MLGSIAQRNLHKSLLTFFSFPAKKRVKCSLFFMFALLSINFNDLVEVVNDKKCRFHTYFTWTQVQLLWWFLPTAWVWFTNIEYFSWNREATIIVNFLNRRIVEPNLIKVGILTKVNRMSVCENMFCLKTKIQTLTDPWTYPFTMTRLKLLCKRLIFLDFV